MATAAGAPAARALDLSYNYGSSLISVGSGIQVGQHNYRAVGQGSAINLYSGVQIGRHSETYVEQSGWRNNVVIVQTASPINTPALQP